MITKYGFLNKVELLFRECSSCGLVVDLARPGIIRSTFLCLAICLHSCISALYCASHANPAFRVKVAAYPFILILFCIFRHTFPFLLLRFHVIISIYTDNSGVCQQQKGVICMNFQSRYARLSQLSASDLMSLALQYLPMEMLKNTDGRERAWPAIEATCTFLKQILNPGQPCREAVRTSNISRITANRQKVSNNTSAYCKARKRLPERVLEAFWKHLAAQVNASAGKNHHWKSHNVGVVDGSSFSMPDTCANQKLYPQPSEQKNGCGFPVVKVVGVFSMITGALHGYAKGNLSTPERTLFHALWSVIVKTFDLLVGDRGFCSFADMYFLKQAGVDSAFRLHQGRHVDWRRGKRLGKHDHLVKWNKPQTCPKWLTPDQYATLPETWVVRVVKVHVEIPGFRTQSLIVATTLLDHDRYTAADIAELYGLRWSVELFLRHNKTTMRMDILRCLSPEMIHREIHMHWIAYNLVRTIMFDAAQAGHIPVARLSFKGTMDTLRQWLPALHAAANKPRIFRKLYEALLSAIALDPVPFRPCRSEPRAVKRRPKKFHLLNKPRHLMGNLPHLNRPTKKTKNRA